MKSIPRRDESVCFVGARAMGVMMSMLRLLGTRTLFSLMKTVGRKP